MSFHNGDCIDDEEEWVMTKEELKTCTPSRLEGVTDEQETEFRLSTCAFIRDLGVQIKSHWLAVATSQVFFHRFFTRQSFLRHDQSIIGATCLFLAGKVEECPKKLKDVVIAYYELKNKPKESLKENSEQFVELKDAILINERIVLQTLCFQIRIIHPYKHLTTMVRSLTGTKNIKDLPPEAKSLCDTAWKFTNDSFRTTLCLQFESKTIAMGILNLSLRFLKWNVHRENEPWYATLGREFSVPNISSTLLEEVSHQMLELYERMKDTPASSERASSGTITGVAIKKPAASPGGVSPSSAAPTVISSAGGGSRPSTAATPAAKQEPGTEANAKQQETVSSSAVAEATAVSSGTPAVSSSSAAAPAQPASAGQARSGAAAVSSRPPSNGPPKGGPWQEDTDYFHQGSGPEPYRLRKSGSVYSCTCPIWRRSTLAEEVRTCRHIIFSRSAKAEEARVGKENFAKNQDYPQVQLVQQQQQQAQQAQQQAQQQAHQHHHHHHHQPSQTHQHHHHQQQQRPQGQQQTHHTQQQGQFQGVPPSSQSGQRPLSALHSGNTAAPPRSANFQQQPQHHHHHHQPPPQQNNYYQQPQSYQNSAGPPPQHMQQAPHHQHHHQTQHQHHYQLSAGEKRKSPDSFLNEDASKRQRESHALGNPIVSAAAAAGAVPPEVLFSG